MRAALNVTTPLGESYDPGAWRAPEPGWIVDLDDRLLTDLVDAEDDPERVQSVHLRMATSCVCVIWPD